MIELDITPSQIKRASELYEFKELNNSITKGVGNTIGALGEILVFDHFSKTNDVVDFTSTYDYDMTIAGSKIDVKTKASNFPPKPNFRINVSSFNIKQKCDYYFFVIINLSENKCWLAGYYPKDLYYKDSFFSKKGDGDINGFKFKSDCHSMQLSKLKNFK